MDIFLVIFICIIIYFFLLLTLKQIGFGKKQKSENCNNACPDCNSALNRVQRKSTDHMLNDITFRMFDCRRYFCSYCGWEGLRWEKDFHPNQN